MKSLSYGVVCWGLLLWLSVSMAEAGQRGLPGLVEGVEMHGFLEARSGLRLLDDPHEKRVSVMETRAQGELFAGIGRFDFKYKGDAWGDGITERGEYATREFWFFSRLTDFLDITIGRQVLTWGTGDLVFLNDLFPKDWQSFFLGRDDEYLKAPSDAAKISLFAGPVSIDLVYTPQFDPDRYVTGEYLSRWDESLEEYAGRNRPVVADCPDRWWRDDETALRVYTNIGGYEYALYGYRGFWKSPVGETASGAATFSRLSVYGASVRGPAAGGIANAEVAYYRSVEDGNGSDPDIRNSEVRYLAGYSRELGRDLTAGGQYYVEHILDYGSYRRTLTDSTPRDRIRHVLTLQLTQLFLSQNLELSFSAYFSPSDRDAYLRPLVSYKYSDHMTLSAGGNFFLGACHSTFFAQFERDTNIYLAFRYAF